MENNKTIFLAKNISELLYQVKNVYGLQVVGGCTSLKELPEKALSIRNIAELKTIVFRERFIDFGPATTLNQIINFGKGRVPRILQEASESCSNYFVRNMATLGGNICASQQSQKAQKRTLYAPLLALGASLKFKTSDSQIGTTIPLSKFSGVPEKQVLTSIRVPADDWDVSIFRRLGPDSRLTGESASFCFLAKTSGGVLSEAKIAFAGPFVFMDSDLEIKLLGTRLPLSKKTIQDWTEAAQVSFEKAAEAAEYSNQTVKDAFKCLALYSLNQLT